MIELSSNYLKRGQIRYIELSSTDFNERIELNWIIARSNSDWTE